MSRLLLDYCRNELELPVAGFSRGVHIGWTVDVDKAQKVREAGGKVTIVPQGALSGFEISFPEGATR